MAIEISNLPTIPPADIARGLTILADATDANGQTYTGKVAFEDAAGGGGTTLQVHFASLVLTPAQIISGNTTPIPFGLTVPAGYWVLPLSGFATIEYGTVTYDTGADVWIRHVGATNRAGMFDNILSLTADGQSIYSSTGGSTPDLLILSSDIEAVVSADGTVGDSTVTLYLAFTYIEK